MFKKVSLADLTKDMKIRKRDGRIEPFSVDKLNKVCLWGTDNDFDATYDLIHSTVIKLDKDIPIDIKVMYQALKDTAKSKISRLATKYEFIAAKFELLDLYREAHGIKNKKYTHLDKILTLGVDKGIYDSEVYESWSKDEIDELNSYIDQSRDYLFTYNALHQFNSKYCKNYTGYKKLELPQHTYMRVSMGLTYNLEDRMSIVKKLYDYLSIHLVTFGSPIMINAFTPGFQPASCVVSTIGNSTSDIMNKLMTAGKYTKGGGGLAFDVTLIQAKGSLTVKGVKASGLIPYIKNIEKVVNSMVQSETRRGMALITCQWWHLEILDFLLLKDNGGTEDTRAKDLKYAFATNKYFLDRVESSEDIYLFDPLDAEELYWAKTDKEFERIYNKLLKDKTIRRNKINARELYKYFIKQYFQTGNVYETRLSNINPNMTGRKINSSNLCLSGDTEIEIYYNGFYKTIKLKELDILINNKGYDVSVLSRDLTTGKNEYKKITNFSLTSDSSEVVKIKYSEFVELILTPDHQVYTKNSGYKEAKDLTDKDIPLFTEELNDIIPENRLHFEKIELKHKIPVYDITVEDNHNFYANEILVHNCQEILEPSRPGRHYREDYDILDDKYIYTMRYEDEETALCNLASYNLAIFLPEYRAKYNPYDIIHTLHIALDNTIDIGSYPRASGKSTNELYRYIGLGVSNYAYYLAKKGLKFSDPETQTETYLLFQELHYLITKSNIELAKTKGKAPKFDESLYSKGKIVYDLGNEYLKDKFKHLYNMEWDRELRDGIKRYGLRNILYQALPPTASSALAAGLLDSIEPILDYSYEIEGSVITTALVPEFSLLNKYYELAYDIPQEIIIILAAIRQLFIDQAQSVNIYVKEENWNYNYIMELLLLANRLGVKTSYYLNSNKQDANEVCESCSG